MRHRQVRPHEDEVAKQHEVEIERARGGRKRSLASGLTLDGEQALERLRRIERRACEHDHVEERWLGDRDSFRLGFEDRRLNDRTERLREAAECELKVGAPIALVRPKGNGAQGGGSTQSSGRP